MIAREADPIERSQQSWTPSSGLAAFVQRYDLAENHLGTAAIYHPLPARSDCFLQFYLKDNYQVVTTATGLIHQAPRCVLIGPHRARREDLLWTGSLKTFTIRFSPVGFRALFGIPARAIRDYAGSPEPVIGTSIVELESRLAEAGDAELPGIAENYLLSKLAQVPPGTGAGVALQMIRMMRLHLGNAGLGAISQRHGLGLRQMERIFQDFVGVTPKMFARLDRLARALSSIRKSQAPDWSAIALTSGYYDQAHLIREFKALNGATPVEFTELGRGIRALPPSTSQAAKADVAFVQSGDRVRLLH